MLEVQKYLQNKTFDDLTAELGVVVKKHDTLPLAILNYDQIESPKVHPVTRECRGLVLHADTKEIVAKSFNRFFNWGEVVDEMSNFDFSDFTVQSKEDGSLVVLYYHDMEWHANTRGSFGLDKMQDQAFSWREGVLKAMGLNSFAEMILWFDPNLTYICEFCSPWNKVVRRYDKPKMYLLTIFRGKVELTPSETDAEFKRLMKDSDVAVFNRPISYEFHGIDDIQKFISEQAAADPTFEGVVIRDKHGNRWKIKNAAYIALHAMRGEGDNLFNPKHLLPFILSGEEDELLTYYPEVTEAYFKLKSQVQSHYIKMIEIWIDHKDIVEQKDFALSISGKTKFTSILFQIRKKYGANAKSVDFRNEWKEHESQILKVLK